MFCKKILSRFLIVSSLLMSMILCMAYPLYAQSALSKIEPLTVGDTVPDITFGHIFNFKDTAAKLSDFHGKLVIIDFWGTYCSSCIGALPGIDALQKRFKNKLQVLTVTEFDTKQKVLDVFDKFKDFQDLKLPVVFSSQRLSQYFPHQLLSHVVWIDGNRIVKAITGTEYVNAKNIRRVLNGEPINWPVKQDVTGFNYSRPLLQLTSRDIARPSFFYYSSMTSHIEGIDQTTGVFIDSAHNTIVKTHFNASLLQLCCASVNGSFSGSINPKYLILKVKDSSRFMRNAQKQYYSDWAKKNTFCYSWALPLTASESEQREFVKKDLAHWLGLLGLSCRKAEMPVKCLLLVDTGKSQRKLLKSKGGKYYYGLNDTGKTKLLVNSSLSGLLWQLNRNTPNIPWVIDSTGISSDFKIDMRLNITSFQDIGALKKALGVYGLDLIPAERKMKMYIITDIGD